MIVAAIGTVTYNFDNDLSYTLNPGDSVLITKGEYHQPVITEPRVTLSFSWTTMKILLITDQHFGVRNDNPSFIDHYRKFYKDVVLPFVDAHKIDTVIALGDTFDKRRSINFMSLEAAKEMWFNPLQERNVRMHMLVGNHDIYYKNTLRVNAPGELLEGYDNISVYTEPTTVDFDGIPILLCLGYVTRTETNPYELLPKVMLLSVWVILSLTVLKHTLVM